MDELKSYSGPDPEMICQLFLKWVNKLVSGRTNFAMARSAIFDALLAVAYEPTPEDEGTLDDFTTEERLNLVLETNIALRQSYRRWMDGQEQAILDHWPAQELYQAYRTEEPINLPLHWRTVGGQTFDSRMIALKNIPFWQSLSSFGLPYPPFAPGSGYSVRDVERDIAVRFGLLDRRGRILPSSLPAPVSLLLF